MTGILLLLQGAHGTAQSVDITVSRGAEAPLLTIFDQITDPIERREFRAVWDASEPARQRDLALRFVQTYPRSILLREAYELAARAFLTLGDLPASLEWAKRSLRLIPENPFLLVMAADVAIRLGDLAYAEASARDALRYITNADTAAPFTPSSWPRARDGVRGTAHRVLGHVAAIRGRNQDGERELLLALGLNPDDGDAAYLLGRVRLAERRDAEAAPLFAHVMKKGSVLAPLARTALQGIYARLPSVPGGFDAYAASLNWVAPRPVAVERPTADTRYAGSASCRGCHDVEVERWQATGMARMLRPYSPEHVIGDFSGAVVLGRVRPLVENGRHYVELRDARGWARYPVDYVIGSKWQQAYATTLADGRIQVFPVQYSRLRAAWVNYWALVDGPGSSRTVIDRFTEVPEQAVYQTTCAPCHTSQLRFPAGPERPGQARFQEGGINCEMCHGPSQRHVETMSGAPGAAVSAGPPLGFRRLSAAESVAICAQCHSQSAVHDVLPSGAANYSDGQPFYRAYASHLPSNFSRTAFYRDGRYRATTFIVESFVRTACFRVGGATCASCHTPHPSDAATNPTSLKFSPDSDEMCLQCHQALRTQPERHTRHAPRTEASRCVSCHMPRIMDALLFPARSHQVDDAPDAAMTERFGAADSPNACLGCHRDRDVTWLTARMAERAAR